MRIATAHSTATSVDEATDEAFGGMLASLGTEPSVVFVYATVAYSPERVAIAMSRLVRQDRVHGGTSCAGVMTESGFHGVEGRALAVLGLHDPGGAYGVGVAPIADDARASASLAVDAALRHAGRDGEVPSKIWLTTVPGAEEQVLQGIEDVVGSHVPIIGGTAADDDAQGRWALFAHGRAHRHAVVATVLFPSTPLMCDFHSGYTPTRHRGRVTRAQGRRLIAIDGKPAARVYDEWTDGAISAALAGGANVLAPTAMAPLGRVVGASSGVSYYMLAHPTRVEQGDVLYLFADVAEGESITLMCGTRESLVRRAGKVVRAALASQGAMPGEVAGALVCHCGAGMLAVQPEMDRVVEGVRSALSGAPFLGAFTFGEQGCSVNGKNHHGNLTISSLLFSKGGLP